MAIPKDFYLILEGIYKPLVVWPQKDQIPIPALNTMADMLWAPHEEYREKFDELLQWGKLGHFGSTTITIRLEGHEVCKVARTTRDTLAWPKLPPDARMTELRAADIPGMEAWYERYKRIEQAITPHATALVALDDKLKTWNQVHWAMPKLCRLIADKCGDRRIAEAASVKQTSKVRIPDRIKYDNDLLVSYEAVDEFAATMFLLEPRETQVRPYGFNISRG